MLKLKDVAGAVCLAVLSSGAAQAIEVTANFDYTSVGADNLANSLLSDDPLNGISNVSAVVTGHTKKIFTTVADDIRDVRDASTTGTFTNLNNTWGLADGIIMSTGDVKHYETDYPAAGGFNDPSISTDYTLALIDGVGEGQHTGFFPTAEQNALLTSVTSVVPEFKDVSQFTVQFDVAAGVDKVYFSVVFGTEEMDENGTIPDPSFQDALGIFLDNSLGQSNIATFDNLGSQDAVNSSHSFMLSQGADGSGGVTALNGILDPSGGSGSPVMLFVANVETGSTNTLTFILGDAKDGIKDSTVYISGLTTYDPRCDGSYPGTAGGGNTSQFDSTVCDTTGGTDPDPTAVSEPTSLALLGLGLLAFASRKRKLH